jgi:hypothetical protein
MTRRNRNPFLEPKLSLDYREHVKRDIFEKIKVEICRMLPRKALEGWDLRVYEDKLVRDFIFVLSNFMIHGKKEEEDWQEFPSTWFDHLKWHLNFRFKTKFKVRMSKIARKTTYMRCCPHHNTPMGQKHVEFLQFKDFNMYDYEK